jgi:unsaturated rhamnogalacturonyl hydrolase
MKNKIIILGLISFLFLSLDVKASQESDPEQPSYWLKLIGDKLVRDTPFQYAAKLNRPNNNFNWLHFVDFKRGLGKEKGIAYAYTELISESEGPMNIDISHGGSCSVWLNGDLVYSHTSEKGLDLRFEERSIELSGSFDVMLKKGRNKLIVKNKADEKDWVVYLSPPSTKGAVLQQQIKYPKMGLNEVPNLNSSIADITNWLIIGPFDESDTQDETFVKDWNKEIHFGKMYAAQGSKTTWTIPKVDIFGTSIDSTPWGTNYDWNYHNGGVAWAMQELFNLTENGDYKRYADQFCDFHIDGTDFILYQFENLRNPNPFNGGFLFSPLLDYTLAPSLPFLNRMMMDKSFSNMNEYKRHLDRMIDYALNKQVRLPGPNIYTRITPEIYTTWVDDMFMGIPFLVHYSKYTDDQKLKNRLLDDASSQIFGFRKEVWNSESQLFMHAKYSERDMKLPHWSRANGWGIWAISEVLMELPKNHSRYKQILKFYQEHVDSLIRFQNQNGFWLNVLDRPDSREEVSGTAIFTMAIARGIRNGWLNKKKYQPYAEKGWKAITSQIQADGTVKNICYGTMCSEDVNYYLNRPFYDNDTHGLFAVIFAGIEMQRLKNMNP